MDAEISIYITLVIGFICAGLTVESSQIAKKNNYQHANVASLYIHLASTLAMYALLAWGMIEAEWWAPIVIIAITFPIAGFILKVTNWKWFFNAIPFTGGITTAITLSAWAYWALSR